MSGFCELRVIGISLFLSVSLRSVMWINCSPTLGSYDWHQPTVRRHHLNIALIKTFNYCFTELQTLPPMMLNVEGFNALYWSNWFLLNWTLSISEEWRLETVCMLVQTAKSQLIILFILQIQPSEISNTCLLVGPVAKHTGISLWLVVPDLLSEISCICKTS